MLEHVPMDLLRSLRLLVGASVLARENDPAQTLQARLSDDTFLHPSWVLAKGNSNGGRYINLNTTRYAQHRRVLWATPMVHDHTDEDGDRVIGCLCYPHLYQKSPLL